MSRHAQDDSTARARARIGGMQDGRRAAKAMSAARDAVEDEAMRRAAERAQRATDGEWPPPTS